MRIHYKDLLRLQVSHEWSGGATCRDFDFVLPAETARVLRGSRLMARERDGALRVLFETDENGAPLGSIAGVVLRVGLKLTNPYFSNYTAPTALPPQGRIGRWQNRSAPGLLDGMEACILVGSALVHPFTIAGRPATVTLTTRDGRRLGVETVRAPEQSSVSFDLRDVEPGPYDAVVASGTASETTRYLSHPEFQREGILGVVDITLYESFVARAPTFDLAFAAKRERLSYYVVVGGDYSDAEFRQLTVSDVAQGRAQLTFTNVPIPPNDPLAPLLARGDARIKLFQSTEEVARRQDSLKEIGLRRNGTSLLQHLPQPGPERPDANMIIHVSKPRLNS